MSPDAELSQAILYDGIALSLKKRNGDEVEVKLRLIRISEIPEYLDVCMEEGKGLEFCIESPEGLLSDDLTDESFDKLLESNYNLNFTRARDRIQGQLARAEEGGMAMKDALETALRLFQRFAPGSPPSSHTPSEA